MKNYDGINISYCTFYNILTKADFISPKCNKDTRKNKAKALRDKLKNKEKLNAHEEDLIVCNNILALEDSHPRQPRAKYFGEKLQMDASEFIWFGDKKTTLHGAIDDATGRIKLYFDRQETLKGYYGLLNSILIDFGIPYSILTDNRTVFYYSSKKDEELVKDTYTQFGYACMKLGIDLQTTSIAQKKGRIERLWNTLQSRLPVEMRIAGVNSIEEANLFILDYCEKFNEQFALPINDTKNVFEKQPSIEEINYTLAILTPRVFDNGCSIKYQNKYWQAYDNGVLVPFKKKTKALVIKAYDGQMLITVDDHIYELREIPSHQKYSVAFMEENKVEKKEKKIYIPPMSHPWKHDSYISYLNSLPHHQNYANV